MKLVILLPTYNERDNIVRLLDQLRVHLADVKGFEISYLVIDDNSPDGTAKLVEDMRNDKVNILKREKKSGLGTAYLAGFKYAIEKNYDFVFEMDADFSHDPKYLKVFIEKILEGYDLVIGSRYINGISVLNWPLRRLIMSYMASVYTRMITGLKVMDTTAGFMCYRVTSLKQIDLDKVKSNGYSFQIEMKFKFFKKGFKIFEVPILFIDRREGESKMSRKVVYEAYFMVWKLKFKSLTGKL